MTTRPLALILAVAAVLPLPASAPRHLPADAVRAGMVGTGITVFDGVRREEFTVRILGVLENVIGPRRTLILARLEGGPLASAGVVAGMSGSPVYIDGKLIGAVSYSLGAFSREPIAGITPIAEIVDATSRPGLRPPLPAVPVALPLGPGEVTGALHPTLAPPLRFARDKGEVRTRSGSGLSSLGPSLRPIATPLSLTGFSADARAVLAAAFGDADITLTAGGGAGGTARFTDARLEPGDAVGVSLVGGDLVLGATGTVTDVDGEHLYAFGHPFLNLGPVRFPMTRAYVHAVLPSLMSSMKIAALGPAVGAFEQDRATAMAGVLGPVPATVPVRIALEREGSARRTFDLRVVNDQLFTPVLVYASVLSVLQSYEREVGAATFTVSGQTLVKGHQAIALEDVFTGDAPSSSAASYIVTPLTLLLRNDRAPVEIAGVDLTIRTMEAPRRATLERVWVDGGPLLPGRTVPLNVLTRSYRGETALRTVPITVPAHASGTLTLLVSDGAGLTQWEQRERRQVLDAPSVDQLIRVFNTARKNNRLYVRLISNTPGAVVAGEPLPGLPPSVLAVYEADRQGGRVAPLRSAIVGEWEFPTDHAIVGSRQLTLTLGDK
jgi:hypothetical protein